MAKLVGIQGSEVRKEFDLKETTVLGRAFDTDIRINDLTVSRHHVRITQTANGYLLEDLGSGNGTFLNERRVEAPTPMQDDDKIRICRNVFRFSESADSSEDPSIGSTTVAVVDEQRGMESSILGTLDVKQTLTAKPRPQADPAQLLHTHERLRTVVAISNAVQAEFDLDRLLSEIMNSLFRVFPQADRGFIMLRDEDTGKMRSRISRARGGDQSKEIVVSRHIIAEVTEKRQAVLSANAMGDQRFAQAVSVMNLRIRSMMCVPLIAHEEFLGLIQVDTIRADARFTTDDLELLTGIGNQMAFAIANAKMHERLLKRQRQERDLLLARQVQHSFLPEHTPEHEGLQFCASYRSAQEVGGDFYDFIYQTEDRLAIGVGDVSGKGVPAALLMARMSADMRIFAMSELEPAGVLAKLNRRLASGRARDVFVTMLFLSLDLRTHKVLIGNAAHPPPVLRRATPGDVTELRQASGFPLGVVPDAEFEQQEFQLQPGDSIFLFTDGVTEAMAAEHQLYGSKRVLAAVGEGPSVPQLLMEQLLQDIRLHVGDTPQSDDLTLVCFGAVPPEAPTP